MFIRYRHIIHNLTYAVITHASCYWLLIQCWQQASPFVNVKLSLMRPLVLVNVACHIYDSFQTCKKCRVHCNDSWKCVVCFQEGYVLVTIHLCSFADIYMTIDCDCVLTTWWYQSDCGRSNIFPSFSIVKQPLCNTENMNDDMCERTFFIRYIISFTFVMNYFTIFMNFLIYVFAGDGHDQSLNALQIFWTCFKFWYAQAYSYIYNVLCL